MKRYSIFQLVHEGKRARLLWWKESSYIQWDPQDQVFRDEYGNIFNVPGDTTGGNQWEEFIDQSDAPQQCPVCGHEAHRYHNGESCWYRCGNEQCDLASAKSPYTYVALENWNRLRFV